MAGLMIGLVLLGVVLVPRAGWTSHDVTTGRHSGYPDLNPHLYDISVLQATQVAAQLASRIPGWRVVYLNANGGEMQAEVTTLPLPRQIVTLQVRPTGPSDRHAEVLIRSRSVWGLGDFGINARNIRNLQSAMDDKLPPVR